MTPEKRAEIIEGIPMTTEKRAEIIARLIDSPSVCAELEHNGWLVGFGLNGPLRQFFNLYQADSQRGRKGRENN